VNDSKETAFDQAQFDAIYPEGVERHYWNRCRNRTIAEHIGAIGAKGPMLEVGCGKGLVVWQLRERGFDITGVELASVSVIPHAQEHVVTGVDVFTLPADRSSSIRTILLLDVIEHLEDPTNFIASLRIKFPNVKCMIFTVPARQELFSNYDEFNGHFRRYDLRTLREHIDPEGTRDWRASYFFHGLYPAALLQLRVAGSRKLGFSVPPSGLWSRLHELMGWLFFQEGRLLPGNWPGTSIIASSRERE
jgi:hypothetical protein